MMTTLIVLATLIAAPLLFGVLLAVGLASFMALYFGSEWMRELRFAQATAPGSAASAGPTKDRRRDFAMTYVREKFALRVLLCAGRADRRNRQQIHLSNSRGSCLRQQERALDPHRAVRGVRGLRREGCLTPRGQGRAMTTLTMRVVRGDFIVPEPSACCAELGSDPAR
jgi:hypothetical protein